VVTKRGGIERKEPDRADAELLQVRQLLDQALEIAAPVAVAVVESADVELVDDRVLVPERVVVELVGLQLAALGRGVDHRKYSKSCSLRMRRRNLKICAGAACGLIST